VNPGSEDRAGENKVLKLKINGKEEGKAEAEAD